MKQAILLIGILLLVGAGAFFYLQASPDIQEEVSPQTAPVGEIVTVRGEITCLPKRGTGPQTMECAIGLLADDGNHYGLKDLFEQDPDYTFSQSGMVVEVSGELTQEEMLGPDGNTYDIVGVITVASIQESGE